MSSAVTALGDLARRINAEHDAASHAARTAIERAIACGHLLLEAKAQLRHGDWLPWVEANLDLGERQARKYMRAAANAAQIGIENADLTIDGAMALLAERDTSHTLRVMGSSESSEWFTPPEIVERVLATLGEVDVDPCWTAAAPVPARRTFAIDEDGLAQRWAGRVYMNPPYGREIDDWVAKLAAEHEAGAVTEAIVLVPARVDTAWFRRLDAYPRCFVHGRLKYANSVYPAPFPNAIFYLGTNVERFAAAFGDVGSIWVRLDVGHGGRP